MLLRFYEDVGISASYAHASGAVQRLLRGYLGFLAIVIVSLLDDEWSLIGRQGLIVREDLVSLRTRACWVVGDNEIGKVINIVWLSI